MKIPVISTALMLIAFTPASLALAQAQSSPTSPPAGPAAPVTPAPAIPASAVATQAPVPSERPSTSNKWRIKFDERSKSDGSIVFRLWPATGEPIDITVPVRQHQAENSIAHATRDVMRAKLGKAYKVEVDDGEDVLVKEGHGTSRFGLQLLSSSAQDVDIRIHKE